MPEHEAPDFEQCAVCGRTALRGERMWDYVTAGGEPRRVCSLCKAQAEGAGWLPLELAATAAEAAPRVSRLFRVRVTTDALGAVLPLGAVLVEAVKPRLLRRHAGVSLGTAQK